LGVGFQSDRGLNIKPVAKQHLLNLEFVEVELAMAFDANAGRFREITLKQCHHFIFKYRVLEYVGAKSDKSPHSSWYLSFSNDAHDYRLEKCQKVQHLKVSCVALKLLVKNNLATWDTKECC